MYVIHLFFYSHNLCQKKKLNMYLNTFSNVRVLSEIHGVNVSTKFNSREFHSSPEHKLVCVRLFLSQNIACLISSIQEWGMVS